MAFVALANAGVFQLPQAHYGHAYSAQPEPFDVSIQQTIFISQIFETVSIIEIRA